MSRFFSHMCNASVHQGHAEQSEPFLLAVRLAVNFPESRGSFSGSSRSSNFRKCPSKVFVRRIHNISRHDDLRPRKQNRSLANV